MRKRIADFCRSDLGLLVLVAVVRFLLHMATNGQYGFHRDELQTLDDARHLDWGFVAYPPVTPLIGRIELILFGTSLIGFRVFSAAAVSIVMVLAGMMARDLGGRRSMQLLAAFGTGISPISLMQGAVFQYVSFDYLWGVTVTYLLIRLLKSADQRWWVPIGVVLGIGMETRYTTGFLALGVAGAVLLTQARQFLRNRWLWLGAGVSFLVFLPNLVWQAQHQFVSLEFLSYLHARDLRQGRMAGFYGQQLWICVNLVTAPLTFLGLWFYFFRQEGRRYRMLGWTFAVSFILFSLARSRFYYTAPLYPVLLAGGSVLFGCLADGLRPAWSRLVHSVQWTSVFIGGIAFAPLVMPVAPIGSAVWGITSRLHDQFREEIGWPELAQAVARVYNSLPTEERGRTGILTGNYGEGGALNLYGPSLGLPRAMCMTNSFWYRGFDSRQPQTVIVVGFDLEEGRKLFDSCVVAASNANSYGVENEESRDHPDILLCRNLRFSWSDYWSRARRFG